MDYAYFHDDIYILLPLFAFDKVDSIELQIIYYLLFSSLAVISIILFFVFRLVVCVVLFFLFYFFFFFFQAEAGIRERIR